MALSARNHLPGVIEEIQVDTILAHVIVRLGEHASNPSSRAGARTNWVSKSAITCRLSSRPLR